ncbi:Peptidase C19, ubiquitin carboxyl-terminal hydrolase,TRAF-like,MATH/TRAF domain,Ubiquitin specific [Cinara cedri]|uniref:Ubiquitin carboxyl-terminal hydrolase 7 n=1 Tax=Cinara cedri TaxID=506608 RepID=A0A5E4NGN0_9HEMI|nr:Peptidase C19, ubiquitin carboxyl-terminal hydrolase,TRAF-like,MATH/TRAF domain,Ubiquitin specific [Cinara cedri]
MARRGKRRNMSTSPVARIMNHMVEPDSQNKIPEKMDVVEDNSRPEATFQFVMENFSELKEQRMSQPFYVRNLPWNIMVVQKEVRKSWIEPSMTAVAFFLQCAVDSKNTPWSVYATAQLRILAQKKRCHSFVREIQHIFCEQENDWGYHCFMLWKDVINKSKGYIKNDTVIFEVTVMANVAHGLDWDSKKYTGYIGLKNQGETCYMNSLLQALYFTNQLRKAVYKMPTESDDSNKSVTLGLQRLFHDLQLYDEPVDSKKLINNFGWGKVNLYIQHNVQPFLRILLDKLDNKMKGTCVEGTISKLFEGKLISYINCKNVDCTSTRTETFYSIQLNIKGKKNIYKAFNDYIQADILDGYRQYHAGEYGLQDAEKGVIFESFPTVLYLHLGRFRFNPSTLSFDKLDDRFEFYDKINLDRYLKVKEDTPANYILHAVFVENDYNYGGYNVVFINTKGDDQWYIFDNDVVSRCSKKEAIEHNFGGNDRNKEIMSIKPCKNAYMLVYIRDSELKNVLQEVTVNDIPKE